MPALDECRHFVFGKLDKETVKGAHIVTTNDKNPSVSQLTALWQAELDHVRVKRPSILGKPVRMAIKVLNSTAGRRCGGARYAKGSIGISVDVLNAPDYVRRYLVAHEWGHVVRGHGFVRYAYLVVSVGLYPLGYQALTKPGSVGGSLWIVLVLFLACALLWMRSQKREYEADAVAVELNGLAETRSACAWMTLWLGENDVVQRAKRISALSSAAPTKTL